MGEHAYAHVPVMAGRITALLLPALTAPTPGGRPPVLIDATLGRAGHARAFLDAVPGLLLIGIDADAAAIEAGRALAERYPGQVTVAHAFYDDIAEIAADAGHRRVQAVLFDLGVSSPSSTTPSRGFSYSQDAPLDMRMDTSGELTAARVVNEYPVPELARVLLEYGEERFARRIAEAIARERTREPITSTLRLSAIVKDAIPARRPAHRRQPGQADLPGAPHRGERRARRAAAGAARRARPARARRPARRPGLPLARGPPGQAGADRAHGGQDPARRPAARGRRARPAARGSAC